MVYALHLYSVKRIYSDKCIDFSVDFLQFNEPIRTSSPGVEVAKKARPRMSISIQQEDNTRIKYHIPVRTSAQSPDDTWSVVLESTGSASVSRFYITIQKG